MDMIMKFLPYFLAFFTISSLIYNRFYRRVYTNSYMVKGLLCVPSETSGAKSEIFTFFVTIAVLSTSLYIIISQNYDESANKWAFGSAGTMLGYWLRSPGKKPAPGKGREAV